MNEKLKMWFLFTRPWSLPLTVFPISFAGFIAYFNGLFNPLLFTLTLMAAVIFHMAMNVYNDYFDTRYKVDVTGSKTAEYRPHPTLSGFTTNTKVGQFAFSLTIIAFIIGIYIVISTSILILVFILIGLILGITYSGKPFSYKYKALGELSCIIGFGPILALGSYFVQTLTVSWQIAFASLPFGIMVAAALLGNNMRDLETDKKAGIKTLPIVVGKENALNIFIGFLLSTYSIILISIIIGILPLYSLFILITLIKAYNLIKRFKIEIPKDADEDTSKLTNYLGIIILATLFLQVFIPI
jgi:1,4-dihydroxy-2-naphthoate octaprenyltransferase